MSWVLEPWTYPFMGWALFCCLILAGIHAYLGFHIVRRGILFVDLAMAQAAALGAAFGVVLGVEHDTVEEYMVSVLFALGSAVFFTVARSKRIHQEAIVATFYGLAVAATFLVLEHSPHGMEEVKHLFVGQVLTVSPSHVLLTLALYLAVGLVLWRMHPRITAISEGTGSGRLADLLLFTTFALVVTSSVGLVGVLLVFSFLVIPSVAALCISTRHASRLAWGWFIAAFSSVIGLYLSFHLDTLAEPTIVLCLGAALVVAVFAGRARRAKS
ncbi:MAG: metal ABC transporter permease [Candidatus Eisenbacteria bacterium]|uniref:Metal ABC transporter permease n=1 Tax=Eiseniibacteriota bacterium TaxID=2212470 RepID=A0A7Y2EBB1_UNCEI|nr:metal ABC transporter permease [Candidatus Eisenbacteria bacterium]